MQSEVPHANSRLSGGGNETAQLTLFGKDKEFLSRRLKGKNSKEISESTNNETAVVEETKKPHKKGSFSGVFVPTCENMWGVLIFLKFFTIIGEGGLSRAIIAVVLSAVAAYSTTVCLSAIASSGGILSEGGPYYMISRALGPYVGATVGVVYWMGITLLAVMESKGAVHAMELIFPKSDFPIIGKPWMQKLIGSGILFLSSSSVFAGSNIVAKLGVIFAGIVLFTIVLFYVGLATTASQTVTIEPGVTAQITGLSWQTFKNNWSYKDPTEFGSTLALFFPCFTGMLSGADRADVLIDPPKNIRHGTFGALSLSLGMYLSFFFLWAAVADREFLKAGHYNQVGYIVNNINPNVAYLGILLSCVAQVLQCLMVAPRLLQAIAKDSIIPPLKMFSPLSKSGEPTQALVLTFSIGLVMVWALDEKLDQVATLVTICFLVCYAFLNATCLLLTVLRTTTWRPEGIFRKRWRIWYQVWGSLGFLTSLAIMIAVGAIWSIAVFVISMLLYFYIDWVGSEAEWGSGLDGIRFSLALRILLGLKDKQGKKINWRPQILVLYPSSPAEPDSASRFSNGKRILRFVAQLKKGKGMCVMAAVFEADSKTPEVRALMEAEKRRIERVMETEEIFGFAEVSQARTWGEGAPHVIQLCGLGGMRPNTVAFSWPSLWRENTHRATEFVRVAHFAISEGKALLCPKNLSALPLQEAASGFIDLWWFIHDGGLLILLTWLLSQHKVWRNCTVRIFVVMENVTTVEAEAAVLKLQKTLERKNILPKGVLVEAVILKEENMIAPYTYDWTLKAEQKKQLGQSSYLPQSVDDLFSKDVHEEELTEENRSDSLWARLTRGKSTSDDELGDTDSNGADIEAPTTPVNVVTIDSVADSESSPRRRKQDHPLNDHTLLTGMQVRLKHHRKALDRKGSVTGLSAVSEGDECTEIMSKHSGPINSAASFRRLNKVILSKSSESALVLMNLPDIWGTADEDCLAFVAYCECLTDGLDKVVFAKSAGSEIFSLF